MIETNPGLINRADGGLIQVNEGLLQRGQAVL
jgi:hypothetical protein